MTKTLPRLTGGKMIKRAEKIRAEFAEAAAYLRNVTAAEINRGFSNLAVVDVIMLMDKQRMVFPGGTKPETIIEYLERRTEEKMQDFTTREQAYISAKIEAFRAYADEAEKLLETETRAIWWIRHGRVLGL